MGDNVMLGYYKEPDATAAASVDGPGGTWFRTGGVGVMHDHGYVEVRDRAKDVIIPPTDSTTWADAVTVGCTEQSGLHHDVPSRAGFRWTGPEGPHPPQRLYGSRCVRP